MLPEGFLTPEKVVTGAELNSKKRLLEQIAELFASHNPSLQAQDIFDKLVERERLGSTGLGKGIALPHARIEGIDEAGAVFIKLATPVDFDAMDDQPVDLVLALLVPSDANNEHLKILAGLAGFFYLEENCNNLRKTDDRQLLVDMLVNSIESGPGEAS